MFHCHFLHKRSNFDISMFDYVYLIEYKECSSEICQVYAASPCISPRDLLGVKGNNARCQGQSRSLLSRTVPISELLASDGRRYN
jgi:hypothetical protein